MELLKKMSLFIKVILYGFYLFCFVVAVLMAIRQLQIYLDNEDSSSVKFKYFSTSIQNNYPDLSICVEKNLEGHAGFQFDENQLRFYNINSTEDFYKMLHEGKIENDEDKKDYLNILADLSKKNPGIVFEDLQKDEVKRFIEKCLLKRRVREKNTIKEDIPDSDQCHSNGAIRFTKSYESVNQHCVTRKYDYIPGQELEGEGLMITKGALANFERMFVYLHAPNQLRRSYGYIDVADTMNITFGKNRVSIPNYLPLLTLTVTRVTVITKRHNSNEKCDPMVLNDDETYFKTISQKLGCIPVFWKSLSKPWNNKLNMSFCKTLESYEEFHYKYNGEGKEWNIRELYVPPCRKIVIDYDINGQEDTSTIERKDDHGNADLFLKVVYRTPEYEEIINQRKFDLESLYGQVGGFIGIMLGWSMLSIPEALMGIVSRVKAAIN